MPFCDNTICTRQHKGRRSEITRILDTLFSVLISLIAAITNSPEAHNLIKLTSSVS